MAVLLSKVIFVLDIAAYDECLSFSLDMQWHLWHLYINFRSRPIKMLNVSICEVYNEFTHKVIGYNIKVPKYIISRLIFKAVFKQ